MTNGRTRQERKRLGYYFSLFVCKEGTYIPFVVKPIFGYIACVFFKTKATTIVDDLKFYKQYYPALNY